MRGRRGRAGFGSRSRRGFSLIELLITVAIIASLVGIAVPTFNNYIYEAQVARTERDLDTFGGAIARYDALEPRLFSGSSMKPLEGRFLQTIPKDAWGNEYFLDADLGVVGSYGGDGVLFGSYRPDPDIYYHYNPFLVAVRAYYSGPFGVPRGGNKLTLLLNKVFRVHPSLVEQAPNDVVIIKDRALAAVPIRTMGFVLDPKGTDPSQGILSFVVDETSFGFNINKQYKIPVAGGDQVDLAPFVISITEVPAPDGPYYDYAELFKLGPKSNFDFGSGLKIERR